jgi:tetratricopeptide (TPR) repeat protein
MTTSLSPRWRRIWRSRSPWLALLCILLVAPASALAGKNDEAKAHIAKATKAHKEGRYEDARAELEAAYAIDPKPELLFALGQVYAKLGNCDEAISYYKRFAVSQSDPQVAQVVDQAIASCKPVEPASSEPPVAETPDKPAPEPRHTAGPPPAKPQPTPFAPSRTAPSTAPNPPWYEDKLGDGLVIGGAVALVIGIVEYRRAVSDIDAAGSRDSTTTLERYHELIDSAHGKRNTSIVLIGAGSALIGAGIVRYVLHSADTEVRGVGVAPTRGGGVVSYEGRF